MIRVVARGLIAFAANRRPPLGPLDEHLPSWVDARLLEGWLPLLIACLAAASAHQRAVRVGVPRRR